MRKQKAVVKFGMDWVEVLKLLLPLTIFAAGMFWLGTLVG